MVQTKTRKDVTQGKSTRLKEKGNSMHQSQISVRTRRKKYVELIIGGKTEKELNMQTDYRVRRRSATCLSPYCTVG